MRSPPVLDVLDIPAALAARAAPSGAPLSAGLASVLRASLDTLAAAIRRYGAPHIATAFNGGKDATVVLHLVRAAIAAADPAQPVRCMYLVEDDAFPDVDAFVRETVARCGLDAAEMPSGFKAGIQAFVEQRGVVAFVLGTRRTDPHASQLDAFTPSSPGWPRFMRVCPILDWEYEHVWEFLRAFAIPYCGLYDNGYTSIGNVRDTVPNPCLADPHLPGSFKPAYMLTNPEKERSGRTPPSAPS
jgi:FAD synthetase